MFNKLTLLFHFNSKDVRTDMALNQGLKPIPITHICIPDKQLCRLHLQSIRNEYGLSCNHKHSVLKICLEYTQRLTLW